MGDLNGDRAKAAQNAAKTLRAVLRTEEPEEHAKAIHREICDRAAELLKGHKTRPFTAAQTDVLCDLIASAMHMHNLASKKPDAWLVRLWRQFSSKPPMDQVGIAIKVILFCTTLSAGVSVAWYAAPAALRRAADIWEGKQEPAPTTEQQVPDQSTPPVGEEAVAPDSAQVEPAA